MYKDKVCPICGDSFHPNSSRQLYCNKKVIRKCSICGKDFESSCNITYNKCCSKECTVVFAKKNSEAFYLATTLVCELCGKEFHPRNNTQRICYDAHKRKCSVCGKEFILEPDHSKRLQDNRVTCSEECHKLYRFRNGNPFSDAAAREKARATMLEKYGVEYPGQSKEIQEKMRETYLKTSGYDHPSHNPDARKGKNYKHSSLEKRAEHVFNNNQIEYIHEYLLSKEGIHHSFDFFLPKYNILVDIDGDYYHGYLDDSNGLQVSEDRDSIRPYLVPEGCMYYVIVESKFTSDIQNLLNILKEKDAGMFSYSEYMMNWCRSMPFPFPEYDEKRMIRDYNNLCKTSMEKYNSYVKYGLSTIRNFHKSIYHANVKGYKSLYEAWNDDAIIKKAIANRMMYVDSVDPSKVLRGMYISKIAPKVSVFNPVLAKYLCDKYFSDVSTIVDPFSGFSGRLLGSCAAGKHYIGSDLNVNAVAESNQIIRLHNLDAEVSMRNVLDTTNQQCKHAGLLTCPPYLDKEQYDSEVVHLTCEQWIDEIVCRYSCKRYLFVVDDPGKYFNNVVEEIITKSYFCNIHEYVVLIG